MAKLQGKLSKLEMLRGLAALYVMFTHLVHSYSFGLSHRLGLLVALPFHFGHEAVMLFFLISGL